MSETILDFEKPVLQLEAGLEELKLQGSADKSRRGAIRKLRKKLQKLRHETFSNLTPWQRTLLARHPDRPYFLDLAGLMFEEATEIHGDRAFRDDPSIVILLARFEGSSVVAVGHQKGRNVKDNIYRNFGMPHPEGCRLLRYLASRRDQRCPRRLARTCRCHCNHHPTWCCHRRTPHRTRDRCCHTRRRHSR